MHKSHVQVHYRVWARAFVAVAIGQFGLILLLLVALGQGAKGDNRPRQLCQPDNHHLNREYYE